MGVEIIYGVNPVCEALCAGTQIELVYLAVGLRATIRQEIERLARQREVRILVANRRELDRMTADGVHQGVVAVAGKRGYVSLEELVNASKSPRTVLLCVDGVQDPRNLGALARSALAFGAAGLVIPARRAAGVTPAAVKASAGALIRLPVARVKNLNNALDLLKKKEYWVTGAVLEGGQAPWEFDPGQKVVLVLGSEGAGIRPGLASRLDHLVRIPMDKSSESLNVSVAGALLLYEWLSRPQKDGKTN